MTYTTYTTYPSRGAKPECPVLPRVLALLLLLLLFPLRLLAGGNPANHRADSSTPASPDGRFIFRQLMDKEDGDDTFGILDARTKRPVPIDAGDALSPSEDSIACVWAPDSKHFAVNARLSARYETTDLFEWTGKKFRQLAPIEKILAACLTADRNAQLKKAGVPANTDLRHIWDTYKTLQWEDGHILKIFGSSTRSYITKKGSDETAEVVSAFTFTLKFDKNGHAKIITKGNPPPENAEDKKSNNEK